MRRTALVATLAVLALAGSAHAAQPGWSDPMTLGTISGWWGAENVNQLAVTAGGDAIATWYADGGVNLSVRSASSGAISSEPLPGWANVAADGGGNAYLAYRGTDSKIHFKVRPDGGSFGSEEVLDPGAEYFQLVAARDGDVALVWADGSSLWAAFRPAGGSFGTQQLLGGVPSVSAWAGGLDAALSANGDLVVAAVPFRPDGQPPTRVTAIARRASGETSVTTLSDGSRQPVRPSVAVDDSGRAIAVWSEVADGVTRAVHYSQRAAGEAFGARVLLHRTRVYFGGASSSAAMSADGVFTLSAPGRLGRRIYTGQAGGPAKKLRSYYEGCCGGPQAQLTASPSGAHVLAPVALSSRAMTAMRTGGGAFDTMQDLRHDCGDVSALVTAVGEGGQPAALVSDRSGPVLLLVGAPVAEQRSCLNTYPPDQSSYVTDPYAPGTAGGPAEGGVWEPGAPGGNGPPPPAAQPFGLGYPWLEGSGLSRTARVVIACPKGCETTTTAKIHFFGEKGEVLALATRSRSAGAKPTALDVPLTLTAAAAKKLDDAIKKRPKYALLLQVKVTATDAKGKKASRKTAVELNPPF